MSTKSSSAPGPKNLLREIVQPFVDLIHAPRALWGINLAYLIEGMVYFGILLYLAIYFSDFVFRGVEGADDWSHKMVGVQTAGITLAMVLLGGVADKWGVRKAILSAFALMLVGRALIAGAPTVLGLQPTGVWSPLHLVTMGGILLVIVGYGMYQPAAYAGVRHFTTPKTSGMAFAMLYALMNLGGWLPTFAFLLRDRNYLNLGIPGTYWVYAGCTLLALILTTIILSKRTVERAVAAAKAETARSKDAQGAPDKGKSPGAEPPAPAALEVTPEARTPLHMWVLALALAVALYFALSGVWRFVIGGALLLAALVVTVVPVARRWVSRHPLADLKFCCFIFALIPVQTLFTYNWFVLPQYISRTYAGWIGEYYEVFSSLNALLIFVLAPVIAASTQKRKVYNMMILGTLIMAAPAFLLVIGPTFYTLAGYIVLMTIGEAMWQPRFLQYAAEIAPEGRTGQYMGVAQLPWFLTKVLVPLLYSGKIMARYCPTEGPKDTQTMWLIFGCIAVCSSVLLFLMKGWIGKSFKARAA